MDEHKHCQKCLQVMRWKDTNTVKSVCRSRDEHICQMSSGHEMDGHKHCQKCLAVMRWMNTLSKVSAGLEMAGQTQSIVIRNSTVMRWINTVKSVSHEVDGHIVKSAGHETDGYKHCQMSAGHEMD